MPSPGDILSQVHSLPTLPSSVNQFSKLMRDPMAQAADFERVIKPDPALTANLLRLANSAFFGFLSEIASVRQAVTLMGFKRVYELALGGAFSQVIPTRLYGYDITAQAFWSHCLATAILTEKLAGHLGRPIPDMIFTAGILHDIGKIVLSRYFTDHLRTSGTLFHHKKTHHDMERELVACDHGEIGALLAQLWNLPAGVEAAIRWHHNPSTNPEETHQEVIDLVHVAETLAHLLEYTTDLTPIEHPLDSLALDRLHFKLENVEPFLKTIRPLLDQAIRQMTKIR